MRVPSRSLARFTEKFRLDAERKLSAYKLAMKAAEEYEKKTGEKLERHFSRHQYNNLENAVFVLSWLEDSLDDSVTSKDDTVEVSESLLRFITSQV